MIATGSRSLREGAAVAGERSGGGVAPGAGSGIVEPDPDAVSGAGNGRTDAFAGGRFAKHFQQKEADAGFIVEHVAHARPSGRSLRGSELPCHTRNLGPPAKSLECRCAGQRPLRETERESDYK